MGSIRYDWHSDYASSISPKLAFSWNIFDNFIFKASIGSGFKAPTFQQLYLDWTNSIAGYSVFGVTFFEDRFKELVEAGIIRDVLVPVESIKELQPERSISFNFGFLWDFLPNADLKVNFFRNNISEMIETLPVANKMSGAQVFSYFNLSKVYTQGIETSARYSLFRKFYLSVGYQYLEAFDVNILKDIKNKKIWVSENGRDRAVRIDEYGGLFNRSRHSANVKLEYDDKDLGLNVFLRGNYRGRYGFNDRNNSRILDSDKEYAPSYTLWNITASKDLPYNINIQVGVDNIFDYFDPQHLFSNPGRTFYINLVYRFIKH